MRPLVPDVKCSRTIRASSTIFATTSLSHLQKMPAIFHHQSPVCEINPAIRAYSGPDDTIMSLTRFSINSPGEHYEVSHAVLATNGAETSFPFVDGNARQKIR
jgi:hypothetical protein